MAWNRLIRPVLSSRSVRMASARTITSRTLAVMPLFSAISESERILVIVEVVKLLLPLGEHVAVKIVQQGHAIGLTFQTVPPPVEMS